MNALWDFGETPACDAGQGDAGGDRRAPSAAEQHARDLLDALPAAIYTTDAEGRITFFNRAAVEFSGRTPTLGSDEWCVTWRLYRPDGTPLPHDECPMAIALKEDRPVRGAEAIAERPDGTRIPFIPYPTPLHDASGKLVGAVNMLVDISHRKQAEQALRESEARLADELKVAKGLHDLTMRLLETADVTAACQTTLDAVIALLGADMGTVQSYDPATGTLRFVAQTGFDPTALAALPAIDAGYQSTCGRALRAEARVIVADFENDAASASHRATAAALGYRAAQSTPLMARSGEILGMITTHFREPHRPSERELRWIDLYVRQAAHLIERAAAEDALRTSEERHRHIVESAREYAIIVLDGDGQITSWNSGAERLLGYREAEAIGRSGDIFFTPEDRAADQPEKEMHLARTEGRATNERWHMCRDGTRFWGSGVMLPLTENGQASFLKIFRDRTDERRAEDRQTLLIDELNHRVKNTLAIVQGLAQQTFKGDGATADARRAFDGRLEALAAAHNLLTREKWDSADLTTLVQDALHACHGDADRFTIDGPPLRLEPKVAVTVAMALHELCTNATKYGALSVAGGRVSIGWEIGREPPPSLAIRWEERGGPPVTAPIRRGFGSRMIERALVHELGGKAQLDFRPEGLACEIRAPLPRPAEAR